MEKSMKDITNMTGYPHIDKPWMQYYDTEVAKVADPKTNITDYIKIKTAGAGSYDAHQYYGKSITYDELYEKIDDASKVLSQIGVKKGDIVMNLLPSIPEAAQIWLGCAQIGATADFIDPRPDSMDLRANALKVLELIKYERAKYIVALDKCYLGMLKPIENELKDAGIENIIIISAADSMNLGGKISYLTDVLNYNDLKCIRNSEKNILRLKSYKVLFEKINSMQKEENILNGAISTSPLKIFKYSELVKECKNSRFIADNDENSITYIGHTSGTSGSRPKPITSTNKNGISTIEQLIKGNVAFEPKDTALHVLPFFAPFGAYDNYLLNLASKSCNIDVPEFEINEFGFLLKKYHPNIIMGTPAWLAALPDYDYLKKEDLSCIKTIIYGGDSMTAKDEERVNEFLKAHGSNAVVEKGHGMSEFCGCGTYAQDEYNLPNSIGIPLPNTIYSIVDPNVEDRLVPLKFEEGMERLKGEIVVSSDAVTNGKLNENIIVPKYEMDGVEYIRTRDLGEMDRNGVFYHEARKDRSFTRFDGYKVKPYEIESIIEQCPSIRYAKLVDYYDDRQRGIMPICHVVLNGNEEISEDKSIELIHQIVYNYIISNPDMSSRQIPSKFKIRSSMPLTKNNKVDFNALRQEELDGTEINVDVRETNLSVEDIDIYISKNKNMEKRLTK